MKRTIILIALLLSAGCGDTNQQSAPMPYIQQTTTQQPPSLLPVRQMKVNAGVFQKFSTAYIIPNGGVKGTIITDKAKFESYQPSQEFMLPYKGEPLTLDYFAYQNGKPSITKGYLFFSNGFAIQCELSEDNDYSNL